jgi:hypothetical protein
MASQRILIFSIGGEFAITIWSDICRWSTSRIPVEIDEWSPEDWPDTIQQEVDQFVTKLLKRGYLPPVLYRSEHVDTWSTGDVFSAIFLHNQIKQHYQLLTHSFEIKAAWIQSSQQINLDQQPTDEMRWLYSHTSEAIAAWREFAEHRLLILVRVVLEGLWEDSDVLGSLNGVPSWWLSND